MSVPLKAALAGMLGLGLKAKIFGLGLDLATQGLGPRSLVNITAFWM